MQSEARVNRKKAVLGFQDGEGDWYALDNAAVIMPAVSSGIETSLFRLSATVDHPVLLPALEAALERVAARFPYFVVELRPGLFWHHLVPGSRPPRVEPDSPSPCQDFDPHRRGTLLFRVRARGRTIACEFSHIITDGTGGLRFLKTLLAEYLRLARGTLPLSADEDLLDLAVAPHPEETEDAYNRNYRGTFPPPQKGARAFHLGGSLLPRGIYRVTSGTLPLAPVRALAKELGASLTEFLVAVYLESLQTLWFASEDRRRPSHISLEVPVNLRAFFPTKTNRNFSLFSNATLDLRLGKRDFAEIVAKVHHQLRSEIDIQSMRRQIRRNVQGGRALAIRAIPLSLKAPVMRYLYHHFGLGGISGLLSNLGAISLPEALAARVEGFDFLPAPSTTLRSSAACLSWKDRLSVSFGSLGSETRLERHFFARLQALGLPVRVECRLEES